MKLIFKLCSQKDLAKQETPKGVRQVDWEKAIEMFDIEEFIVILLKKLLSSMSSN